MKRGLVKLGVGALLIGVGVVFMMAGTDTLRSCVPEVSAEQTADEVAAAGAEMVAEAAPEAETVEP